MNLPESLVLENLYPEFESLFCPFNKLPSDFCLKVIESFDILDEESF